MVIKDTPLPPVGEMSPEQHTDVSRRFILEHFPREKRKENRLQASEKVWGAVSHALIAVGKQRGWIVGERNIQLQDVAIQLGAELDEANSIRKPGRRGRRRQVNQRTTKQDEFLARFKVARSMHSNFYQNHDDFDAIDPARRNAEEFIKELESLLNRKPTAYTPRVTQDQKRLARLLGFGTRDLTTDQLNEMFRQGKTDPNGFSPNYGYRKPDIPDDDGEGSGGGVSNPDPKPNGGQGGEAIINGGGGLNLQRRENPDPPDKPAKPVASGGRSYPKRTEPKAPAQCKVAAGPGKERRRVIAPRPTARR